MSGRRPMGGSGWTCVVAALGLVAIAACDSEQPAPAKREPAESTRASETRKEAKAPGEQASKAGPGKAAAKPGQDAPAKRLVRHPTEPDPLGGELTLEQALEGLPGKGTLTATLVTRLGELRCRLFPDKAPRTVANFVGLARGKRPYWDAREGAWVTRPYYDGTNFHRVIPTFMIQGGDYLGTGAGDIGYQIPDEVHPSLSHDRAGQLCMANRGPDTNAAQFFITEGAAPHLDGSYTIFGQCEPTDVITKIARVPQSGPPSNRPVEPVVIEKVTVERR